MTPIQIAILTVYSFICGLDYIWCCPIGLWRPLVAGAVTGIVLGDPTAGVMAGALIELAFMGLFTIGGGTVPEAASGTITAVTLIIAAGLSPEAAVPIAFPIGILTMNIEIFVRSADAFFIHWADRLAEKGDLRGVVWTNILGAVPWALSRTIPVAIFLVAGVPAIEAVVGAIPEIFWSALGTAGAIMPAMGIAALFNMMYRLELLPFYLFGFVLAAYLEVPMMGIALITIALVGAVYLIRRR